MNTPQRVSCISAYICCSIIVVVFASCFGHLTQKKVVYENDFEGRNVAEIEIQSNGAPPAAADKLIQFNGSTVLGTFNNNAVKVSLKSLPEHEYIRVEFDLFVHDLWRGNYLPPGSTIPDIWNIMADGNYILSTTFSNTSNWQDYPNYYQSAAALPPRSYAQDTLLPGACASKTLANGTTRYRIVQTFAHSANSLTLLCNDALQGSICEKSWSMDNLKITALKN